MGYLILLKKKQLETIYFQNKPIYIGFQWGLENGTSEFISELGSSRS